MPHHLRVSACVHAGLHRPPPTPTDPTDRPTDPTQTDLTLRSRAAGQHFPSTPSSDNVDALGATWSAGGLFGRGASQGGWYTNAQVPFGRTLLVTARTISGLDEGADEGADEVAAWIKVSGSAGLGVVLGPHGVELPPDARLEVQTLEAATHQPLSMVPLASVPAGRGAAVLSVSMGVTSAAGTGYIEGCFHTYTTADSTFPGLTVGTGFEDYFASAFWFGAASGDGTPHEYAQALAGMVHFDRGAVNESIGAYRNHDRDLLIFTDGGSLQWRVGDVAGKCDDEVTADPINNPQPATVTSYAFVYTWAN